MLKLLLLGFITKNARLRLQDRAALRPILAEPSLTDDEKLDRLYAASIELLIGRF